MREENSSFKMPDFYDELLSNSIFISGLPRSGTTLLGKIVGSYWIDYESQDSWGGTRVSGSPAPWLLKSHHKNTKIFYERHKDLINNRRLIDNRELL